MTTRGQLVPVRLISSALPQKALTRIEIPAEAIVWESSDPNVVKVEVSADDPTRCTLTGVGSGSCNVTVTVYGASDTAIVRYVG